MALFRRNYDYDYDFGYRSVNRDGGRSYWATSGRDIEPSGGGRGRGWGYGGRYGSEYPGAYGGGGYDRPYKSQWETDYGDPFGDREQQTPMRVIRSDIRRRDRGFMSGRYDRGMSARYDRDYERTSYPWGYRPYAERAGYDAGYNRRTFRTYGDRYDRDWL